LLLSGEWITVCWSVQALVMLWIAGKLRSGFLQQAAFALYIIVLFRLCLLELPDQYSPNVSAAALPVAAYLRQLVERFAMFGTPIASMFGAYRLLARPVAAGTLAVERANDIEGPLPQNTAVWISLSAAVGVLFVYLHLELARTFAFFYGPLKLPVLTLLWLAMCAYLLNQFRTTSNRAVLSLLACFLAGVLTKLVFFDLPSWHLTAHLVYADADSFRDAAFRLLDFGSVVAFCWLACALLFPRAEARDAVVWSGSAGIALSFVYATLELNTFLHGYVEGLRPGGISILWSLFALGLIAGGIWKRLRGLRLVGLGLFAVVAVKVFFVDLAQLEQLYRIVAFVVLGLLVLTGSLIYLRYRQLFAIEDSASEETGG
jgi:uncharacterized membrane protein